MNRTTDETSSALLTSAFCGMVLTNLMGNTLVCLVVLRGKGMKTPMNYLLCNLAIADMTVAIFVSPQFIWSHAFVHPEGSAGRWLCRFVTGGRLMWVGAIASAFFLVSIAFERYLAVVRPTSWNKQMTTHKVKMIAIVCWGSSVVWVAATIATMDYDHSKDYCVWKMPTGALHLSYIIGCVVVIGAVPIWIMFFLYFKVVYTLWFKHNMEDVGDMQLKVFKARQKSTKIVVTVTILYCVCWIPHLVILGLSTMKEAKEIASVGYRISVILVTLNSSVNPIIYTLQSRPFRKNIARLVGFRAVHSKSASSR